MVSVTLCMTSVTQVGVKTGKTNQVIPRLALTTDVVTTDMSIGDGDAIVSYSTAQIVIVAALKFTFWR